MKIFDSKNILGPLKFILKLLFGIEFKSTEKPAPQLLHYQTSQQQFDAMEKMWKNQKPSRSWRLFPKKVLGMSGALLGSVILAFVTVGLQFVLVLIKRGKAKRLDMLKKKEEEEAKERMRLMEEEWKKAEEKELSQRPEFMLTGTVGESP